MGDTPDGRTTATFLFTDIEGSTRHWEASPTTMDAALRRHDTLLSGVVERHGGRVFGTAGDSMSAVFDHPEACVQAAIAAQRELAGTEWGTETPIRVRMGIHTGVANARGGDFFGPTLNRVARLMSIGHGGQVLVSGATHRLIADDMPPDVECAALGTVFLKDLDRPEDVFQLVAPGVDRDFGPLRTGVDGGHGDDEAEAAYRAKDWQAVVDALEPRRDRSELTGDQAEMLAWARWWLGDRDEVERAFEAAHALHLEEGDLERAAAVAVEIAELESHNLRPEVARAWLGRAERLLEGKPDAPAMGMVLRRRAVEAFEGRGDLEGALELLDRIEQIGRAAGDVDLQVLALQDRGRFMVAAGFLDEGRQLMDQAMVAAVAGDVSPQLVGRSYCNMLSVCEVTGDVRRAAEWSATAERWCNETESTLYPGICRIYKAEVTRRGGDWERAEREVLRASTDLELLADFSGEAWYQFGLMRLRAGDVPGAEQAFEEALSRGREPVPAFSLVLRAAGDLDGALSLVEHAMLSPSITKLTAARFLPYLAQLRWELGDAEGASAALDELERLGELAGSDLFLAQVSHGRGILDIDRDPAAARSHLEDAARSFGSLGLPFEAARARMALAQALRASGADRLADMEHRAATGSLTRLGLDLDTDGLGVQLVP